MHLGLIVAFTLEAKMVIGNRVSDNCIYAYIYIRMCIYIYIKVTLRETTEKT